MVSHDLGISETVYLEVISAKTAALFAAATELGAVVSEQPHARETLRQFGQSLGIAFQLVDDALDYQAREEELGKAITVLSELLKQKNLSYAWSARAGYTLAAVLKNAGSLTEALEACYDVVQAIGYTGPANPSEYRWYYRAGFFGIDLLEAQKEWEAAARLAEKIAASKGDRAEEARRRATQIRLDHFLWDESPTATPPE
jgi:hypothetical protein